MQAISAKSMPADPWAGLVRSSERAHAAVDAFGPCERSLEDANAARLAGTPLASTGEAQRACAGASAAVEAAGLGAACRSAAADALQAAAALARGEDAGRAVARYRATRTKCLSETAA